MLYRNHHSRKRAKAVVTVAVLVSIVGVLFMHPWIGAAVQCVSTLCWIWLEEL